MNNSSINQFSTSTSSELDVLLNCTSDAVFILKPESFRIIESNKNAALLLGYFQEALKEYSFLDFLDIQSQDDWFDHIQEIENGNNEMFSGHIKVSSSNKAIIESKSRFLKIEQKKVIITFIKEVTGFPYQINQLKKQLEFYTFIFNEMPTEFAVLSPQWRYMFVNKNSIKDDKIREWIIGLFCNH